MFPERLSLTAKGKRFFTTLPNRAILMPLFEVVLAPANSSVSPQTEQPNVPLIMSEHISIANVPGEEDLPPIPGYINVIADEEPAF